MRLCSRCGGRYPDDHLFCPLDGSRLEPLRSADWLVGKLLHSTYRVKRLIAEGGMSSIYLAVNERIGKEFAIKVLDASDVKNAGIIDRFFNEARAAAALGHPGVVEIYDCVTDLDGISFMVMQNVEGEDVETILNELPEGRSLDLMRALWIAEQAAEVLSVAHAKNIVHRDVKPANLFIAKTYGGGEQVKVLDFGVARLMSEARVTHGAMILGTPAYMSPEQAMGDLDIDHRSDIYSLGATIYHCLCGRPPFRGESPIDTCVSVRYDQPPSPRSLRPDLPIQLESLILWMLSKDREMRPQSMEQVREELKDVAYATQPPLVDDLDDAVTRVVAGAEVRIVTALVADIEPPSTADIELQVDDTNRAFNALAEAVTAEGGSVGHLAGSRAVGLFGMAMSFGDEPLRAVRAAVAIQRQLGDHRIVRVAVGTGRTVVPADSVTTGPAAAAAARLLSRVDFGEIAVDASTYRRIRGTFKCRKLESVGGRPAAYRISDLSEQVGLRSTATAFGRNVKTIGRKAETDHLVRQFERVIEQRRHIAVTICGVPGVGKTRVKADLVVRISSQDAYEVTYLEGAGQGWGHDQPFAVIGDLLRRRSHLKADLDEDSARSRIWKTVVESGIRRSPEKVADLLAVAAGVGPPKTPSLAALSGEVLRQRTIDAFVQLISAFAERAAVVVCVEDAQSVDEASLEALSRLSTAVEDEPVMLVFVGRPECWERLATVIRPREGHLKIQLQPLSFSETSDFLKALLGSEPPDRLLEAVWERTNGVPLFIEEVLFALRQQGSLVPQQGTRRWVLVDDADLSKVPATVEGLVFAQLDALPQDLKDTARRAAIVGTIFWDEAVAALGIDESARRLAELSGRDVIVAQEHSALVGCREYAFRSSTLQEVAYNSLPSRERELMHLRAAEWFQRRGAPPLVLGHHLARAGRTLDAARHFVEAGAGALASYANQDAAAAYSEAARLCDEAAEGPGHDRRPVTMHIEALFGESRALRRLAEVERAVTALEEAERIAQRIDDKKSATQAMIYRGALIRGRDPARAVVILGQALDESRDANLVDLETQALLELSQAAASTGDLRHGATLATSALRSARVLGFASLVRRALVAKGWIATMGGDTWTALEVFTEALDIARHARDHEQEAEILTQLGFLTGELGDMAGAERYVVDARALSQKTQNRNAIAHALVDLGWIYWKLGDAHRARDAEEEAIRLSRDDALIELKIRAWIYLAVIELGEGKLDEALRLASQAARESSTAGHEEQLMHATMVEALVQSAMGNARTAADLALRAVDLFSTLKGTFQFEVELHLVAAACLEEAGRSVEGQRLGRLASQTVERRSRALPTADVRTAFVGAIGAGLPPVVRERFERYRTSELP